MDNSAVSCSGSILSKRVHVYIILDFDVPVHVEIDVGTRYRKG